MPSWTPSPVFVYECMVAARRWQTYAGRVAVLGAMLVSLMVVWIIHVPTQNGPLTINELGRIGEAFFPAIVGTQLVLALLAAPAYLSASICLDKARGTLTHMLVTDLSATEIVLGKLGARALPVFGMLLAGVPVLVLTTLLGGIEPWAVVFSFFVIAATALVTCALALALSVWGKRPHEVLLGTYAVEAIWLLAWPAWNGFVGWPAPDFVQITNPFQLLFGSVVWDDLGPFGECAVFAGICIGMSVALTLFAILTLRLAARRDSVRRAARWRLPRLPVFMPRLDWNPVLWREWRRRTPSPWLQLIWGIYIVLSFGASAVALSMSSGGRGNLEAFVNAFQFSIGLLLVSITSVGTLFEERANGSLDVLLATPLTTAEIVWGKWLAGFRMVILVMLLPTLLAVMSLFLHERPDGLPDLILLILLMLAYGAFVNSFGLALSTWLSRFGIAMGLAVSIFVLLAAGPILLVFAMRSHSQDMEGFACLSPWYGVGLTTFEVISVNFDQRHFGWRLFWLACYSIAAVTVVCVTQRTFNRCLGRAGGKPRGRAQRKNHPGWPEIQVAAQEPW
jgi:ABC-type transport system involved in multi-copper enzyme maturation permease subunit